jgi:hypothetical protein
VIVIVIEMDWEGDVNCAVLGGGFRGLKQAE